ncbi:DUF4124 domain-containing protein [Arenimonas donghaensis]|uniref:DUF4124 domain-containing protein n=1 Tax=Arenimonas donghaensis DSM 18148 = HO3-R19 TaxID=1121014 RepID=A0A087MFX4_9GAMM|nr:DUF4124 domain-containing protein [Arenimonas donghaensis]KFL35777.1 hypothetical protein N788_06950 [Arenimonas donghaensis DSM 18148 = HO3-R19]
MPRIAPLLLLAALLFAPLDAAAQTVFRCVGPDGRSVYSDQPCQSLGAVERQAPTRPAAVSAQGFTTGTGTVAPGCARSLDALLLGVRGALEARDVNRLATHYHWAGTSARGGRYLMDELERIAARPLMAIDFVFPQPPAALPEGFDFGPGAASQPQTAVPEALPANPAEASPTTRPRRPEALRIEQASSATDPGAVRTDFLLRRHAGCWWIEL